MHLYLGFVVGFFLSIIAVTGALYAFEPQLRRWWGESVTPGTVETRLTPGQVEALLREAGFDGGPVLFLWPEEQTLPLWVGWMDGEGHRLDFMIDPMTGIRLPRAERAQKFFHLVLNIHRTLAVGEWGKRIVGLSAGSLVLLTFSGLFISVRSWKKGHRIWFPARAERKSAGSRLKWRFWHRILGSWLTPWLLLMPLTGMVWSFESYADLVRWLGGPVRFPASPVVESSKTGGPVALDKIWDHCLEVRPGDRAMRLVLPSSPGQPVRFEWSPPGVPSSAMRSRLFFNPETGALLESQLWDAFSEGEKLVRWAFPLHTGRIWGLFGQILTFCGALSLPFFFGSGIYLYFVRRRFKPPSLISKNKT